MGDGISMRFVRQFDIVPDPHPVRDDLVPLSQAARYLADPTACFDPKCHKPLPLSDAVWMADDSDFAYPFHPTCAEGPWPMYRVAAQK